jgi:glycosyltransferase involved in cell wall biosynthesis
MRITIVGPSYPLRGGIAHHVYWLERALTGRGHQVQVVSFSRLYPGLIFPGTSEIDRSNLKLDPGGLPLLSPLNPVTWARAARAIKRFDPHVVIIEWWQPFFAPVVGALARAARRAGHKVIIECHNVFPHERTPAARRLLAYAFAPVDHFITHSTADRRELETVVPGREIIVSGLPALDEFYRETDATRGGRTALFFGKVRKYKGLGTLLGAFPKVLSQVECRLLVAGEFYDSVEKYRKQVSDLGLESHVQIENRYVPNEEVPDWFEKADVLVLPYLSATQSGVARIALRNALPIIAARTGGLTEVVRDRVNGLLFAPGDSDALADALIDYFKNGLGPGMADNLRRMNAGAPECRIVEIVETIGQAAQLRGRSE